MAAIGKGNYQHSIVQAFDEATESLKTTLVNADVNINVDAFTDSIAIADASGNKVTTTLVGGKRSFDVNVTDITLSGANDSVAVGDGVNNAAILTAAPASDTGQAAIAVRIVSQLGAGGGSGGGLTDTQLRATPVPVSGTVSTGGLTDTQIRATALPVSASSLPLPAGASTSALQTTGNTSLGSIDTKTPALGQALAAASVPVVLTAAQLTTLTPLASVSVSNFPASQAVTGPLTDAQLRLTPVPVSGTVTTGGLTDTQIRATALPVSGTFFQNTQPISAAALPLPSGAATESTLAALNTKVTAVNTGAVTISAALPTGTNSIGTVVPPALTKGTQGSVGITTQDLKDAGRNQTNYYMVSPLITTATDAVQLLTGYKSGAAVAATATPAVVTAGKTYRITSVTITYVGIATTASVKFTLRANTAGVAVLASPAVLNWVVGAPAAVAGVTDTIDFSIPGGLEFSAGTGIAVSMQGFNATQVAAAGGYAKVSFQGYEY